MNVLFLIGNGFDINVELKTHYTDVLDAYLKIPSNDPRIEKFKINIKSDSTLWSNFERTMGIYTENFISENVDDYCFCIKNFREFLVKYLRNEEARIDYGANIGNIISIFRTSIGKFYNKLTPLDKGTFTSIIEKENSITYNFVTFNYTNVLDKCIEVLTSKGRGFDTHLLNRSNSNTSITDYIGKILHIHGTTEVDMIMGVDNVEQIKNKELSNNKKLERLIIKPSINKKRKNLNHEDTLSLIDDSQIICLFGLSLGETDKCWWEKIGTWLKDTDNKHLVIFEYIQGLNSIHPDESIENEENIIDKFFLSANITQEQDKNKCEGRIHIGINTNMFKIDLIKKD